MNRLKVWLYALAVAAAFAVAMRQHSIQLRTAAVAGVDARLASAAAQAAASARALARQASAVAAFAARDEKVLQALRPSAPPPAARGRPGRAAPVPGRSTGAAQQLDPVSTASAASEAARAAVAAAQAAFGFELPAGATAAAASRELLSRTRPPDESEATLLLRAAMDGQPRRGHVRASGKVFYASASPAGTGAAVVVLVPVDEVWAREVAAASGVDVTVSVPDIAPVSTARAKDVTAVAGWRRPAGLGIDIGRLEGTDVSLGPAKLPRMPLLFGEAPALRARAVALDGVRDGYAVVSAPLAPALAPVVQAQWRALVGVAGILLVGLVLGFLVRPTAAPALVPEALVAAATRIEKGDFGARAPALAGKLGTIAAALNRAAEVAGPAAAAASAKPSLTDEFFARAPGGAAAKAKAPAPAPASASAPAPEPLGGGAFEAAPARASAPGLLKQAAQAAPPQEDEAGHWQAIYEEFLRTRSSCGESSEGLTYEKFKVKLEGNKAQLVSKYGCRTVRFQVYVKEGKAALKATPVK